MQIQISGFINKLESSILTDNHKICIIIEMNFFLLA